MNDIEAQAANVTQQPELAEEARQTVAAAPHSIRVQRHIRSERLDQRSIFAEACNVDGKLRSIQPVSHVDKLPLSTADKEMIQKLPAKDFIRVNRSFIVPESRILAVRNKTISLSDREIPIGNTYTGDFFKRFPQ